jgi:hypothetical protein
VRLIVEIQRIRDQFLDIHVGRAIEPGAVAATSPVVATIASAAAFTAFALWSASAFAWAASFAVATLAVSLRLSALWFVLLLRYWLRCFRHSYLIFRACVI